MQKIKASKNLPFLFFGIVLLVFYTFATGKFGDDVIYAVTNPLRDGLFAMQIDSYYNFSSRMFIHPTMVALILSPIWLWRVLDLAVMLILAVCISRLFTDGNNAGANWFIVALMLLYPLWHMGTAGWIATTVNFTWPLAFAMFAFLTLKRAWEGEKLRVYRSVLFALALLYASDAEQCLMILVTVFACLAVHSMFGARVAGARVESEASERAQAAELSDASERRIAQPGSTASPLQYRVALYGGLIFLMARLIFTLTAPGNHVRSGMSHHTVPGFDDFSLWHRFVISFELAAMHYTFFTVVLFPFFALFLAIIVWKRHSSAFKRAVATVPLAVSLALTAITFFNALTFARGALTSYEGFFLDGFIMTTIPAWQGSNVLFITFFACLLYALYLSCLNISDRLRIIAIMLLGFLSQLVLGLSPSLYGSAFRTFLYASFAIIVCSVILYENGAKDYLNKPLKLLLALAGFISYAITFTIGIVRMAVQ